MTCRTVYESYSPPRAQPSEGSDVVPCCGPRVYLLAAPGPNHRWTYETSFSGTSVNSATITREFVGAGCIDSRA